MLSTNKKVSMKKETSTNAMNEAILIRNCGMAYTLSVIGGRWKPNILYCLLNSGRMRYNELRRSIAGISERMLVAQLRELEEDGLVKRIIYPEIPPRVEYELTAAGISTQSMLECMSDWGNHNREDKKGDR